jgi:hypothetical protein
MAVSSNPGCARYAEMITLMGDEPINQCFATRVRRVRRRALYLKQSRP